MSQRLASGLDVAEGRNGAFLHLISAPRNPLMPLRPDRGAKILNFAPLESCACTAIREGGNKSSAPPRPITPPREPTLN